MEKERVQLEMDDNLLEDLLKKQEEEEKVKQWYYYSPLCLLLMNYSYIYIIHHTFPMTNDFRSSVHFFPSTLSLSHYHSHSLLYTGGSRRRKRRCQWWAMILLIGRVIIGCVMIGCDMIGYVNIGCDMIGCVNIGCVDRKSLCRQRCYYNTSSYVDEDQKPIQQ